MRIQAASWLAVVVGFVVVQQSRAQRQPDQPSTATEVNGTAFDRSVVDDPLNLTSVANDTDTDTDRNKLKDDLSSIFGVTDPGNITDGPSKTPSEAPSDFPTITSNADYYDMPKLKWATTLYGTGSFGVDAQLGKGNAVVSSPDGVLVYVTLDNGNLHTLSAHDGKPLWSYTPQPLSTGWSVTCSSGVYFGEMRNGDQYAVYAVIDVPPEDDEQDVSSRVVAVSHPSNRLLWKSQSVPGSVQGTPIITQNDPGLYVFFTHNQRNMTSGELVGTFSMLNGVDGTVMFTEMAGESRVDPDPATLGGVGALRLPYAPLGVSHKPEWGRYPGGTGNVRDLFIWSTSDLDGRGDNGYTKAFQLPKLFEPVFAPALFTYFLRETRWNAVSAPAITEDGMDVVFGVRENKVRGWTGLEDFDKLADLTQSLGIDPNDSRLPIPFSPVLTQSERFFVVATTTSNLSLLRKETGDIIWTISFSLPISDTPAISHDDNFVYVTTEDGVISALSIETGDEVWSIMCEDIQGVTTNVSVSVSRAVVTCVDLIDAKSSLSPNGLVFFCGDKYGNVKALQLGVPTIPTAAPSEIPAFSPTGSPSISPSASPTGDPSLSPSPTALRPTHAPIDWPELFMDDNSKKSAASPATSGGSTVIVTSTFLFCSMTMMMIFVRG